MRENWLAAFYFSLVVNGLCMAEQKSKPKARSHLAAERHGLLETLA